MADVTLFDRASGPVDWQYDREADTLYVSFGSPRPAIGVDIGEGLIVRYDERTHSIAGVTIVGIGERFEEVRVRDPLGGRSPQ